MPQKTDAVIAELMDRRLLNDVDPDLHQEIAKAVVKAVHTASLQGEDVVERVARIKSLLASFHRNSCYPEAMTGELNDAAERILATGLVPDEAAVRTDEREKCAKIAEDNERQDEWPLHGSEMQAPSRRMQIAIAAAIRSNRREA